MQMEGSYKSMHAFGAVDLMQQRAEGSRLLRDSLPARHVHVIKNQPR